VALRINAKDFRAHNNLGAALRSRGDVVGASRHYLEALRINSEYAGAHYNLALVLADLGEVGTAISHLESAVRADPDFGQARQLLDDFRKRVGQ
jgi:tetratricopeptide (TPR) repeat protein